MGILNIRKIISVTLVVILGVAIWRVSGGDVSKVGDVIWTIIDKGADIITTLIKNFISSEPTPK